MKVNRIEHGFMINNWIYVRFAPRKFWKATCPKSRIFVQKFPQEEWNPADPLKQIHGAAVLFWIRPLRTSITLALVGQHYHPYSDINSGAF